VRGYPRDLAQMPPRFSTSFRAIPMTGTFPRIRMVATGERSRRYKAWFRSLSWDDVSYR